MLNEKKVKDGIQELIDDFKSNWLCTQIGGFMCRI
jgi:hypothetical protein